MFLLAIVVSLVSGCGPSVDEVSEQAKLSMQEKLSTDENLKKYDLKIRSVAVIHESGNKYKGVADVDDGGESHQVTIDVVADGKNIFWEAKPMAFGFVLQQKRKPIQTSPAALVQDQSITWTVQVASLSSESTALQLIGYLKQAGYTVYRTQTDNKSRVFVGPVTERREADRLRDELSTDHQLKGFVVRYHPQIGSATE